MSYKGFGSENGVGDRVVRSQRFGSENGVGE